MGLFSSKPVRFEIQTANRDHRCVRISLHVNDVNVEAIDPS